MLTDDLLLHDHRASPAALVIAWPDYSAGNPYQGLFYSRNAFGIEVRYDRLEAAIDLLETGRAEAPVLFHLHWLNWLFRDVESLREARRRAIVFVAGLNRFRDLGGILVWTIHNELSHDAPYREAERLLSGQIARIADLLLIHDPGSLEEISEFDMPRDRVVAMPHGHYIGSYPDTISRGEARSRLGLAPEDDVCLFLGQVRRYKGVEALLDSFRQLLKMRPHLKLLVVGRLDYDPLSALAVPLSDSERTAIRFFKGFVVDDDLQTYFRAADVAVFPYRRVLTSGSVMLALSLRVPVAASDCAMIRTVLSDGRLGAVIPAPGGIDQIRATLDDLFARKDEGSLTISDVVWADFARRYQWRDFSVDVVRRLVAGAMSPDPDGLGARLHSPPLAGGWPADSQGGRRQQHPRAAGDPGVS